MDYKDNRGTDYSTPSVPSCSIKLNKLAAISVAGFSCPKTARSNGKKGPLARSLGLSLEVR